MPATSASTSRPPPWAEGRFRTTSLVRVDPDGTSCEAAPDLAFPNGTVIFPDGRTLVVAESAGARLTAFDVGADGSLSGRRVWAELDGCAPDGICLDADGCIWVANALGTECRRVAQGGEVVDRVETSQFCYACALGGPTAAPSTASPPRGAWRPKWRGSGPAASSGRRSTPPGRGCRSPAGRAGRHQARRVRARRRLRTAWPVRCSFSMRAKRTWPSPPGPKPTPGEVATSASRTKSLENSSEPISR